MRAAAGFADEKLHRVGVIGFFVAGHEGVEALYAVDKALGEQEIERAVDGGGLAAAGLGAQAIEQGVGAQRFVGLEDKGEHIAAGLGEFGAAASAGEARAVQARGEACWWCGVFGFGARCGHCGGHCPAGADISSFTAVMVCDIVRRYHVLMWRGG